MFRSIIVLLAALASVPTLASGQTGAIGGIVSDRETGETLPGASVRVEPGKQGDATDPDGTFQIEGLEPGRYTLHVQYLGYRPVARAGVEVHPDRVTRLTVSLSPVVFSSDEVVVTADHFDRESAEPSAILVFDTEAVRTGAGSAGDVMRLLSALPAVARTDDMRNALAVRGGSPLENRFLVDGIPVPNLNHFPTQGSTGGAIGVISPDLIESVTFQAGGFGVEHFDRLSSVMSLELRTPAQTAGLVDFGLAGAGVLAEVARPRGGLVVSARRSWVDVLVNNFLEEQADAVPTYSDVVAKGTWKAGPHRFNALAIGAWDKSSITRNAALDAHENLYGRADFTSATGGVRWTWLWSGHAYSETSVGHSLGVHELDLRRTVDHTGVQNERARTRTLTFIHRTQVFVNPRLTISLGADGDSESIAGQTQGRLGGHANVRWRATPVLSATAGLRVDRYGEGLEVQPRGAIEAEKGVLRGWISAGTYAQRPPSLLTESKPFRAVHTAAGASARISETALATLEFYRKAYRRVPRNPEASMFFFLDEMHDEALSLPLWPDDAGIRYDGEARSRGVEASVRKALTAGISGLISFGWSNAEYATGQDWLPRRFDNRFVSTIDGSWRIDARHSISARWTYAGGQPYTPIDEAASIQAGRQVREADQAMSQRLPAYHSLSLRYDLRTPVGSRFLVAYASVWNVYNRRNLAGYYWDESAERVQERLQWGLLPVLGLKLEL